MIDIFLKFKDEAESLPHMFNVIPEVKNEQGAVIRQMRLQPKYDTMDIIGIVRKPTGNMTTYYFSEDEFCQASELAPVDGWHVNIRVTTEDTSELDPFKVQVTNPVRRFA